MTSSTITETVRKKFSRPWSKPRLGMPTLFDVRDLQRLGEYRGRTYWSHPKYGELVAGETLTDSDEMPNSLMTVATVDGIRTHTTYKVHEPGTFARLSATVTVTQHAKAVRPVDALAGSPLLDKQVSTGVGAGGSAVVLRDLPSGVRPKDLPRVPATYFYQDPYKTRGAAAILSRLAAKGYTVAVDTSGSALVVLAPGGNAVGVADLIEKARPLLLPYLQGEPATCTVTSHKTPTEAVTVVVGGALACADCMTGGLS